MPDKRRLWENPLLRYGRKLFLRVVADLSAIPTISFAGANSLTAAPVRCWIANGRATPPAYRYIPTKNDISFHRPSPLSRVSSRHEQKKATPRDVGPPLIRKNQVIKKLFPDLPSAQTSQASQTGAEQEHGGRFRDVTGINCTYAIKKGVTTMGTPSTVTGK